MDNLSWNHSVMLCMKAKFRSSSPQRDDYILKSDWWIITHPSLWLVEFRTLYTCSVSSAELVMMRVFWGLGGWKSSDPSRTEILSQSRHSWTLWMWSTDWMSELKEGRREITEFMKTDLMYPAVQSCLFHHSYDDGGVNHVFSDQSLYPSAPAAAHRNDLPGARGPLLSRDHLLEVLQDNGHLHREVKRKNTGQN